MQTENTHMKGQTTIKKLEKALPFSESYLLQGLNAKTSHSDELANINDKEFLKQNQMYLKKHWFVYYL